MYRVHNMRTLLLLFLTLTGSLLFAAEGEFRQWTLITGGHFEAKIHSVQSTKVTLENRAGKQIDLPLGDLRQADQKYAREWQLAQTGGGKAESAAVEVERSAFAKRVYKDLVYSKGKRLSRFTPEPGANPKYFAFYRSAQWCPPCRAFTPDLVKFYKKHQRGDTPFELIFISSGRSEDDMAEYMDDYDMPWPAFSFGENKDIVKRNGTGIPNLIVTDAEGNRLLGSYDKKGDYIGPKKVMADFEDLLETK